MLLYFGKWGLGNEEIEILPSSFFFSLSTIVIMFETRLCFNGTSEFVSVGNLGQCSYGDKVSES